MEKISKKTFDAVKMMREIRDKISEETQNMTFEELKAYIKKTCLKIIANLQVIKPLFNLKQFVYTTVLRVHCSKRPA